METGTHPRRDSPMRALRSHLRALIETKVIRRV